MPFDKISHQQLFLMRIVTALTFMALGAGLVYFGGTGALDLSRSTSAGAPALPWVLAACAFVQGVFLTNAGLMLLELTTRPPLKVAINVPFVAANFQTALVVGLVALGPVLASVAAAPQGGPLLQALSLGSSTFTLLFVVMTKLHWNFTENTGKALPS